ncbi:MAG TPA: glycoside hydrolase family 3 N-terminal domain-containing protein [Rhizomicrobium sp.]|nr:glycoside hydrolase family 3 N-terminal domain-containing protein [Rhizomicrobium sp.]
MRKNVILRGAAIAAALCFTIAADAKAPIAAQKVQSVTPLYKNPNAPIPARVEDLLKRMTLEEKVAQMLCVWEGKKDIFDANTQFDEAKAKAKFPNGIGQLARPSDREGPISPRVEPLRGIKETIALVNAVQHWAINDTRLGIPVLFHEEALHGYATLNATSFPQPMALASSWDPDLVREVDSIVAREVRARGVSLVLAPVVDVARDPRWGRIEETFGEDPYLVSQMGVAAIEGYQGDQLPLADGKVFATLKHFTGHGQPESGTNVGPADISERTLRENFFPPFEAAVRRTNVRSLMASYNEIDGIPSHANVWLLQKVLRGEWGYKGAVVSDYYGIEQLADLHHVAANYTDAAIMALKAGVDMDLPDGQAYSTLVQSVRDGRVKMSEIDAAVRQVLTLKFEAELFEHPYADVDAAEAITDNAEAQAVAEKAAERSVVLLKNDGVLPLQADKIGTLAVIGPNANVTRLGGYSGIPPRTVNVLQGLQAEIGDKAKIVTAEGVKITQSDDWWADEVKLADPAENEKLIAQAVDVARHADEIVLVLGDTEQTSREGWAPNHLGDRDKLTLPGQQDELASAIFALGKPVIVVLLNGRPPAVVNISEKADALIEGWYLGQEGGTAMARILLGDVNPGGHLPVTIPRSVGQLPMFYNYKPSAHRGYLFDTTAPLFPFGFGLSYTTFDISAPRLSTDSIGTDGSVDVSVDVKNTGSRAGDEVVQLYIHDLVSSATRPVKELKGFQRVTLQPGESRTLTFHLDHRSLWFWNAEMKRVVEPGDFDIMTGPDSLNLKTVTLHVRG